MRNNFIVECVYCGSEEYKPKDKDQIVILHEFLDSAGNSFKLTLRNEFDGVPGSSYFLNLRLGDRRKDGIYSKYWSVYPADLNKIEHKEA